MNVCVGCVCVSAARSPRLIYLIYNLLSEIMWMCLAAVLYLSVQRVCRLRRRPPKTEKKVKSICIFWFPCFICLLLLSQLKLAKLNRNTQKRPFHSFILLIHSLGKIGQAMQPKKKTTQKCPKNYVYLGLCVTFHFVSLSLSLYAFDVVFGYYFGWSIIARRFWILTFIKTLVLFALMTLLKWEIIISKSYLNVKTQSLSWFRRIREPIYFTLAS